jgi:hypothetical protein
MHLPKRPRLLRCGVAALVHVTCARAGARRAVLIRLPSILLLFFFGHTVRPILFWPGLAVRTAPSTV